MKIQRKITLIRHKMRQVWSSSGEQNSVKQDSECAVYLTSIQFGSAAPLHARIIAWVRHKSFSKLVALTRTLFFVSKELLNNLEFNTNSDRAKILPNTKKLKNTSFSESFQFQFQFNWEFWNGFSFSFS